MTRLETERLILRRWQPSDLEGLAAIDADPEVMRYIGDGSVRTPDETRAALARMQAAWDERGYGHFAVQRRDDGALAGWVGLAVPAFLPEVLPAVEIGWRLGRAQWGQGFATEAARAVLAFGFREVGLERVISIGHVDNAASLRVMAKLGLRPYLRTTVPGHGRPVQVTELTRAEFEVRDALP